MVLVAFGALLALAAVWPAVATGQPPIRYLSQELPRRGAFLPNYYGVTHLSLSNYIALVSGQGSNPQTQADCQVYTEFVSGGTGPDGQTLGQGCVYPPSVRTIADQLT